MLYQFHVQFGSQTLIFRCLVSKNKKLVCRIKKQSDELTCGEFFFLLLR